MMVLLAMQCVGEASQRPPMQEVVSVLEMLSNGERIEWSEMYPGSSSGSKTPHLAPSQSAITR